MNTQLTNELFVEKSIVRKPTALAAVVGAAVLAVSALLPSPAHARPSGTAGGRVQRVHLGTGGTARLTSRLILGTRQNVSGQNVTSWAREGADGSLLAVGVTVPLAVFANPPAKPGAGPHGAIAVLNFPKRVQQTSYFNHLEMHWNPNGHEPACCWGVPHFDLHFFGIPEKSVRAIGDKDPAPPTAAQIPVGYIYPGAKESVPQMGVHAVLPENVTPGHVMKADMLAGFWNGEMHFIEPMITRKVFLQKKSFTLPVPRPQELKRRTLYPTRFIARYDGKARAYHFVYSGFQMMQ